ncbi:hypothetical protein SASPL_138220 [Salvia splendens]|uniref:Uncharacterized protein n=1 Tax=Salvia splendens TaxID=180675 RepID=A0A8X8ZDX5_SALSN|nr:uncharacterized protein LOC121764328 [Salvia splendens]KAG6401366.1 hypothetical protein SASPL_138220 [Salvia splendens]
MGKKSNILRCCLACILPCGALDLIRIVHSNGYVEELTGRVTAGDALTHYPDHVLSKPSASGSLIISPESELKRGSIYFLVPSSSLPQKTKQTCNSSKKYPVVKKAAEEEKKCRRHHKVTAGEWQPNLDSIHEEF